MAVGQPRRSPRRRKILLVPPALKRKLADVELKNPRPGQGSGGGAPFGNRNALKSGLYTRQALHELAEGVSFSRRVRALHRFVLGGEALAVPASPQPLDRARLARLFHATFLSKDGAMAGHSQFKNIMFRKGKQDKERSKLFSKLSREITVASKSGLPDPAHNPRLRTAILAAKAESMPKDNIERAIKKGQGGDAENYDEVRYEGRGPGGVALIVEALTDNRNRTSADVRSTFSKFGGEMVANNSVTFLFNRVGQIV